MVVIVLRLPMELKNALTEAARAVGVPRARLIRLYLSMGAERNSRTRNGKK